MATRYQIAPMDLAESAKYLQHHLALAGRNDPLIADDAVARLHKASLGLPRALNNAAIAALIAATTAGKALVDDDCCGQVPIKSRPVAEWTQWAANPIQATRDLSSQKVSQPTGCCQHDIHAKKAVAELTRD